MKTFFRQAHKIVNLHSPFVIAFIILILPLPLGAENSGATALNFLKIGVGSRISAMGEAGSSLIHDANALYWNPAALAFLEKADLQTTYLNQLEAIHFSQIGFAKPILKDESATASPPVTAASLGFAWTALYTTEIEGRDELDRPTNNFSFYNWSLSGAYAKKFFRTSSLGFSIKLIREAIGNEVADGAAMDLGFLHQKKGLVFPDNLTNFSVVLQHLGPDLGPGKSAPLPFTSRFGISNFCPSKKWMNALDFVVPARGNNEIHLGNELQIHELFAARAGYRFFHGDFGKAEWFKFFTGGFGFYIHPPSHKQIYNLDYAFLAFGNAGFSHRASFGVQFK